MCCLSADTADRERTNASSRWLVCTLGTAIKFGSEQPLSLVKLQISVLRLQLVSFCSPPKLTLRGAFRAGRINLNAYVDYNLWTAFPAGRINLNAYFDYNL